MEEEITKLELTMHNAKVSWEIPSCDASVKELLEAFVGLLVTQTFSHRGVINGIKDYIEEYEN